MPICRSLVLIALVAHVFYETKILTFKLKVIAFAMDSSSTLETHKNFTVRVNYTGGVSSPWCAGCSLWTSIDHFACSTTGNNNGWNNGIRTFVDPIEGGFMVMDSVDSDIFSVGPIPYYGCFCPNCVGSVGVPQAIFESFRFGWPNYAYGGNNTIQVVVNSHEDQDICLSVLNLTLHTVRAFPKISSMVPNLAATGGTSSIIVIVDYLNPDQSYDCFFNGINRRFGTPLNQTAIECNTPEQLSEPLAGFSNTLIVAPNWAKPEASYNYPARFMFYPPPKITSVEPTKVKPDGVIKIAGSGFINSLYLTCQLSDKLVPAQFLSSTSVSCAVPSSLSSPIKQSSLLSQFKAFFGIQASPINIPISVSLNGQDFPVSKFQIQLDVSQNWWTPARIGYVGGGIGGGLFLVLVASFVIYKIQSRPSDGEKSSIQGYRALPLSTNSHPSDASLDISEVKILEKIGRGSFGDIYKAIWRGTEVAVKKIPFNSLNDDLVQELLHEARIMESIRHPNVLSLMGCCTSPPEVCIIMEYMPNGSLYQILHNPRVTLTWQDIQRMALDAARGMCFLHQHTPIIMHRDLKSHNLLVDDAMRVKVADFGLSRMIEEKVSATMTVCGTPCWTAPEVLRNQRYSVKADVYSFGVCMWEFYTRTAPYAGMTPFQVMFGVASSGMRPPVNDDVPDAWRELMTQCWSDNPDDRPDFSDIVDILKAMVLPMNAI